jgi:TrmH family RNA methyltransferase
MEIITSPHNPRVKWAASLREARDRKREQRILIDGWGNVEHALAAGLDCTDLFVASRADELVSHLHTLQVSHPSLRTVVVAPEAMQRLQYGQRDVDAIAVAVTPPCDLETFDQRIAKSKDRHATSGAAEALVKQELYLVLDRMEKPGNLGAILRSADAAGVTSVLMSDPVCEIWNPNAIRASLGAIFHVPIGVGSESTVAEWLKQKDVSIYAARSDVGNNYAQEPYPPQLALVIGNEAEGLEERWRGAGIAPIHIPMHGVIDSLNASVSGSILLFEVARQRMARK